MTNQVMDQLRERMSVRRFSGRPIEPELKETLLEAAFQAPTAGCQQLYTILDITDQGKKERLADLCDHQPFIATAPLVLVFLADCRRWLDGYRAAGCSPRKPGPGDLLLAVADSCIAAQNVVTAAHSFGLGSCYIGDVLEQCEEMRALLSLPEEVVPAAMLVIGWPEEGSLRRTKPGRAPGEYLVLENEYRALAPEEHRDLLARSGRGRGDFEGWMQAFCQRKYESGFSREMSRSAAAYLAPFLAWEE